jgi:hypothetical protein
VSPLAGFVVPCSEVTRFLATYRSNSQWRWICCRLPLVRLYLLCMTRRYGLMTSSMSEPLASFQSGQIDLVNATGNEESNIEKVRKPFLEENKCLPLSRLGFRCIAHWTLTNSCSKLAHSKAYRVDSAKIALMGERPRCRCVASRTGACRRGRFSAFHKGPSAMASCTGTSQRRRSLFARRQITDKPSITR